MSFAREGANVLIHYCVTGSSWFINGGLMRNNIGGA